MNEETKKPLEDSIRRMTEALEEVRSVASSALDRAEHDTSDGLKWQRLSTAVGQCHERTRMGWQKLTERRTPPAAIDAIMANPPLGDLPPGADGVEPVGARVPRVRCERRVESRLDHIGDLICHCARGDADLEALDAAIRWGLKRHRNQTSWLVRKRNGPTIGAAGTVPVPEVSEVPEVPEVPARPGEEARQ